MKIILPFLLSFFIVSNLFATENSESVIVPFLAVTKYDNSPSNYASIAGGIYSRFNNENESIEIALEKISIIRQNSSLQTIKQNDYIFQYANIFLENFRAKFGAHLAITDNTHTTNIQVYYVGIEGFKVGSYNAGAELYYSAYSQTALSDTVIQVKPYLRFKMGNNISMLGALYTKLSLYYLSYSNTAVLPDPYLSFELDLTHRIYNLTTTLKVWRGEQLYVVKDSGFTIYPLNEVHIGGFSYSNKYRMFESMAVKVAYIYEEFNDFGTTQPVSTYTGLLTTEFYF